MEDYKKHTHCRVCKSDALEMYLDLGSMPLSNNLANTVDEAVACNRYPLEVMLCRNCGLSQLSIVVDPKILFSNYVYRSGINGGYIKHCRNMAYDLDQYLTKDSLHVDIAGNDGTLLAEFQKVHRHKVLNVDPARNLTKISEFINVPALTKFWNSETALEIHKQHGEADLITATNVFAHVDNVKDFLEGAALLLSRKGVLVLEFPYLIDFIENKEFDTVYFEHLSYFSIKPLAALCVEVGLTVLDAIPQSIHGGSMRVIIGRGEPNARVGMAIRKEINQGYGNIQTYREWAIDVTMIIAQFRNEMVHLRNHKVAAFAASAKGNTLLNACGITSRLIDYIVDQTKEKIGKFSPGTGIEIVDLDILLLDQPDYLIVLSWNFMQEIISKCKLAGYKGKFVHPLTFDIIT